MNTYSLPARRPLVPEDVRSRGRPSDHLIRLIVAQGRNRYSGEDPERVAATTWPDDRVVRLLTRAASGPATTTTSGWANVLATTVVSDLIVSLGPASAGCPTRSSRAQSSSGCAA